ncbi:hypothetical protein [Psychromicrobium lacuslunae]|uniref:hypothetical protein n=1 Tax=Psychromicrobium lacuslunae TaxID=1618207 RepID=UPI0005D3689D|nr:hypothetical protein [Psychromicrobium lacuslunae]
MTELGNATWIPSGERFLYSWVHQPSNGMVKGAVLIAPPLAREQVISYRTLRVLAIRLAEQGWLAIRFGWTGTGESAEMPAAADITEVWQQDLAAVADFAAGLVGTDNLHAIGLRAGAALLAASKIDFKSRLLWEPIGGKTFLRQHSMLRHVSLEEAPIPASLGTELGGTIYLPEQALALSAVPNPRKLAASELPAGSQLVIEADQDVAKSIYAVASVFATVPPTSIQNLIDLLPETTASMALPNWVALQTVQLSVPGFAGQIIEEILEIGPQKLPAVLSRPADDAETAAGSAILVAASAEPKDGVTSLWVLAARRLAAQGLATIRAERRGSGDLGNPEALRDPNPYTHQAVEDIENVAHYLAARFEGPVTGIGLCAGAWLVGMASQKSPLDKVVMLNNVAWRDRVDYYERIYSENNVEEMLADERRSAAGQETKTLKSRIKSMLRRFGPYRLWLWLGKKTLTNAPEVLMDASSRNAELLMYFGDADYGIFSMERGQQGLKRLRKADRKISMRVDAPLDHALLGHESRLKAIEIIEEVLLTEPAQLKALR